MSEVAVECRLARDYSLENIADALAYLLVKITPDPSIKFGQVPLNAGIVIDVSRSMRKKKIECAIEAAKHIITSLRENDWVSAVTFSDEARVIIPLSKVTDKISMISALDRIRIESGTRMYHGMETGAREMRGVDLAGVISRMIVLTDGETEGEDICRRIAIQEKKDGLVVSTLGIGDRYNENLLAEIANTTVGNFFHLKMPEQIMPIFQKEIEYASGSIITNVSINLNLLDSVKLVSFDRVYPSYIQFNPVSERDGTLFIVDIGNISKDESTIFAILLKLPSKPAGKLKIAEVNVSYSIPDMQVEDRVEKKDVFIEYTGDESLCVKVNSEVIDYFNQVNVQNLVEKAIHESKTGNSAAATHTLSQARDITEKTGNAPLFDSITDALADLRQNGEITSEGIKTIKSGSLHTVRTDRENYA